MSEAILAEKSRIAVSGADAAEFLQGLITTDIDALEPGIAYPGALLTPQGKIFFYFMISKAEDGFLIEIDADQAESLAKRLTMYKLRAKVEISDPQMTETLLFVNGEAPDGALKDSRFEKAGVALYRLAGQGDGSADAYNALRIDHGIVEPGTDFALQDAFPHDILLEKSGGLSFRKGCYVGQEVVSRMQHRATARRRPVIVTAGEALPASATSLTADGKTIGQLGTVFGNKGLAIVRIDRAGAAIAAGVPIMAGPVTVGLALPAWSDLVFPATATED
jgi:tRNA-modifying protein YgfZ